MAGANGPRIVFVIEGGRSRADVAAIQAVATAVERAGAVVKVVRHGLGRVSARAVRRAIAEQSPDVVVTTGATSNRDADGLRGRRGFAVVCYYWPAGPIEDIHRRPRHRSQAPVRPARVSVPTHAVLASDLHASALHSFLGGAAAGVEVQILPPLVDENALTEAVSPSPSHDPPLIGVYGGQGQKLPTSAAYRLLDLDTGPAALLTSADAAPSELARLRECDAVLLCSCGTAEAREAPRRCATALLLGKPVLVTGFGESGEALPLSIAELPLESEGALRKASAEQLPDELSRWAAELHGLARRAPIGLREALSFDHVLDQHKTLLLRIAEQRAGTQKKTSVVSRLLGRLRTLLRRERARSLLQ
jgi:hypothetical protein